MTPNESFHVSARIIAGRLDKLLGSLAELRGVAGSWYTLLSAPSYDTPPVFEFFVHQGEEKLSEELLRALMHPLVQHERCEGVWMFIDISESDNELRKIVFRRDDESSDPCTPYVPFLCAMRGFIGAIGNASLNLSYDSSGLILGVNYPDALGEVGIDALDSMVCQHAKKVASTHLEAPYRIRSLHPNYREVLDHSFISRTEITLSGHRSLTQTLQSRPCRPRK